MTYHPYHQPQPYQQQPMWGGAQRSSAPFSVHVAAFFIYLGGLFVLLASLALGAIALGMAQLPTTELPDQYQGLITGTGVVVAVFFLLIAFLYFLIARKLQRGRQWARVLVLIFAVLGLIGAALQVVGLLQAGVDPQLIGYSATSFIGPVLFIVLLNTSAARSWFRHHTY
ncbi:MAG: hypothetical protein ACRDT8_23645 [Micromonosporaceae bacterium]